MAEGALAAGGVRPESARLRRFWISLALFVVTFCLAGGAYVLIPRNGTPLSDAERVQLLHRSGLPDDFPIHPGARRMAQAPQGGFSYELRVPVPDATVWVRDSLRRSGYQVSSADLEGDDEAEYGPRWLYYRHRAGASGAIIIRELGHGPGVSTEVKILSQQDERLKPPPLPTRFPVGPQF